MLLGEDGGAIAGALLEALRDGATEEDLAGAVAYAAATHSALPHHERVRRLGHLPAHLHLLQRRPSGAAAGPSPELLRGASTPR